MMALGGILNMGLFLQVGSMFIVGITGMSAKSWALPTVMVFLITLVLIYTCLGGMVSVVIADYVQFVVLSFGLLLTTVLAIQHLGWDNILYDPAGNGPAGLIRPWPKAVSAGSTLSGWASWDWSAAVSGRRPSPAPWPWTVPRPSSASTCSLRFPI